MEYAWNSSVDTASKQVYYYNTVTGEVTWDRPEAFGVPPPPPKKTRTETPPSLGRLMLRRALCEIGQSHLSEAELKDWTDESIIEYFSLLPLQSHLGFDWSHQLNAGLLEILDEYEVIADGSSEEFGEYLHEALQIPLNEATKATMLEMLKTKSYTAFIANEAVVANAVDTIQGRTDCTEEEARSLLVCEGEQSFANMDLYKEEKVNSEFKDEFENAVLDAILDALDYA
jgi:hypothetical protein